MPETKAHHCGDRVLFIRHPTTTADDALTAFEEFVVACAAELAQAKAVIDKLLAGQGVAFCVVGHGEQERVVEGRLNIVSLFEPPDTKPDGLWVMDLADCHLTRKAAAAAKNKDNDHV